MKQRLTAATLALLLVGAFGAGAVHANGPTDHPSGPPSDARSAKLTTNPSTSHQTVSYSVRCTPAYPGGAIKVQAKVLHAVRGKVFFATAVATFSSTSSSVVLRQAGKSFVAVGKIPVPAGQAAGAVSVIVSIFYDRTAITPAPTCTSQIRSAAVSSSDKSSSDDDASPNASSSDKSSSDDDASPHSHSE